MRPVQQYQTVHGFYLSCRKISATADEASKAGSGGGGGGVGKIGGGPGKAAMPGPSNLAAFRATLWTHLDQVSRTLPIWEHREEKFVNVVYRASLLASAFTPKVPVPAEQNFFATKFVKQN